MTEAVHGIALLCDGQGMILDVLRNDLNLRGLVPGGLFLGLVDIASRNKALNFLADVKKQNAIFDWELNLTRGMGVGALPVTLHFAGGVVGEQILIAGGENSQSAARLYENCVQLSNEQTNMLRAVVKEHIQTAHNAPNHGLYDEISRLNNEMVVIQRELAKKNVELEHLNQEKNRFLGMAAHDLRSPLHAILSYSGFLLDEDPVELGAQYQEFVQVIHSASEFMAHLVDDLLDVAKIETGQVQMDYSVVDLAALVTHNTATNRALAAKKQIELDVQVEALPQAVVDAAKIEQVLNNLISNAIKFSPPGKRIEVRLRGEGEQFILSVSDQGQGISLEEQDRLFKPFQRGRSGTAGEKSSGLGLAIVKRIVESHGGKIWLASQVGQGSTFFVSFLRQPPELSQAKVL